MWGGGWAVVGYVLLCLVLSLYWWLTGFCWHWIHRRNPAVGSAMGLAVLWASMEYLQGILFTGFGWSSLAYSQGGNLWISQWAAVGGHTLLTAIIVFTNTLIALSIAESKDRFKRMAVTGLLIVLLHGVGYLFMDEPDYDTYPLTVGVMQSDFSLEMKWDRDYTEEMVSSMAHKSAVLDQRHPVDLFVWPEALVTDSVAKPGIQSPMLNLVQTTGADLFTGSVRRDGYSNYNSSYLLKPGGDFSEFYDKIHLAPFGEYLPLARYFPFITQLIPTIGDITPGTEPVVLQTHDRELGPLICFEVLFPNMAYTLREEGADFLVVITNLAWFGASNAIPQELAIARLRAIETRLPLVHCANTGISGVFDPWGRFSMVDIHIDRGGGLSQLMDGAKPTDTIMRRLSGAFKIAAPESLPLENGVRVFPYITCGLSLAMMMVGIVLPSRAKPGE